MKKEEKWTPHIIAATAFVVFIVLGLACASTPEDLKYIPDVTLEKLQQHNSPENRLLVVKFDISGEFYIFLDEGAHRVETYFISLGYVDHEPTREGFFSSLNQMALGSVNVSGYTLAFSVPSDQEYLDLVGFTRKVDDYVIGNTRYTNSNYKMYKFRLNLEEDEQFYRIGLTTVNKVDNFDELGTINYAKGVKSPVRYGVFYIKWQDLDGSTQ